MKNKRTVALAVSLLIAAVPCAAKPLKIYILAGQSNMVGHAKASTLPYMAEDPLTRPILGEILDAQGKPRVSEDVFIKYWTSSGYGGKDGPSEKQGKLTVGFGGDPQQASRGLDIGPELTFGIYMNKALQEPILLIKTAWGGKSLHTDFRPPGAGPNPNAKDPEKVGEYYRLMIKDVKETLSDIKAVYPDYQEQQGYEIAGFVWFQGFNDLVAGEGVYPEADKPGGFAGYSEYLAQLIRDVRKDLATPSMRFVIGVIGIGGDDEIKASKTDTKKQTYGKAKNRQLRVAMAAPAGMEEFKGNVAAVETAPFWPSTLNAIAIKQSELRTQVDKEMGKSSPKADSNKDGKVSRDEQKAFHKNLSRKERGDLKKAMQQRVEALLLEQITKEELASFQLGVSNGGFHYMGCGKTLAQIGKAFAEAMVGMHNEP